MTSQEQKTSRFEFNQNDYPKGTVLLQEYEYKGYFIREFEQEPCENWKKSIAQDEYCYIRKHYPEKNLKAIPDEEWYELGGSERGEGGYEILNPKGEIIEEDWYGMGDSATDNAENEVDWLVRGDIADKLGLDISGKTSIQIEKLFNEAGERTVKTGETS